MDRIDHATSLLLVIDLQQRLLPSIANAAELMRTTTALLCAAREFAVPVIFTEQYPAGLGPTAPALIAAAPDDAQVIEKIHFDATVEPALMSAIANSGRTRVVLCGTEAHVCAGQTGLGLRRRGVRVDAVVDAMGSRRSLDRDTAIARLAEAGAGRVTAEMVLFEWLELAGTDSFRRLLPMIRDLGTSGRAEAAE